MSAALTIIGGVFQGLGLALVFVELAIIRSHELDVPTPWTRIAARVRRLFRRPQVIALSGTASATVSGSGRATVRPGPSPPGASDAERIARLERYVEHIDCDLHDVHDTISRKADELTQAAVQRARELRDEMDRRDEQRRDALRPSLTRQAYGAIFVFVGLVLSTTGGAM